MFLATQDLAELLATSDQAQFPVAQDLAELLAAWNWAKSLAESD
jgi:hypothetical protein